MDVGAKMELGLLVVVREGLEEFLYQGESVVDIVIGDWQKQSKDQPVFRKIWDALPLPLPTTKFHLNTTSNSLDVE